LTERKNINIGEVAINIRIWNLAYADDIVLLAKNRIALIDMDTLRRFLKGRKLELCAEKTKTVIFNKHGKEKKEVWK